MFFGSSGGFCSVCGGVAARKLNAQKIEMMIGMNDFIVLKTQ